MHSWKHPSTSPAPCLNPTPGERMSLFSFTRPTADWDLPCGFCGITGKKATRKRFRPYISRRTGILQVYGAQKEKREYGVHSKLYVFRLPCKDLPPEAMFRLMLRRTDWGVNTPLQGGLRFCPVSSTVGSALLQGTWSESLDRL